MEAKTLSGRMLAGIDIGGTKTAVVVAREPPQTLCRVEFPTRPESGPEPAIREIIRSLKESLDSVGIAASDLGAIGVSCGNPLDAEKGIIQAPPNLATWKDVEICRILHSEFAVPCYLENDANAGALAEYRFGAGRGSRDFIFLTMGTGFGAGLILNGRLYRGACSNAGEIGHVRLTRRGPRGYGKAGSVEGWASGGGMAQVARMAIRAARRRGETTILDARDARAVPAVTARDVAAATRQGDRVAQDIIRLVGERLGEALATLIDVINPECIAIGGLAMRMGEHLLGPARAVLEREALGPSVRACRITVAELGESIGDVAALSIAVQGLADTSDRIG